VFIIVTVKAQQLPVAAVGWIVVVVVVLVMNRELAQFFAAEFTSTPRTDLGKHFECLFAVGFFQLIPVLPGLGNDLVLPLSIKFWFFG
jgi:hypothetical protein